MVYREVTMAAIDLLAARALLLQAEAALMQRQAEYRDAEARYIEAWRDEMRVDVLSVQNVIIENIVILPREDWDDHKPGERLEFHTVAILTEGQ